MHIRRKGKLVTGVIAAVAALALMSLPASANTVPVTINSGTLELRSPSGTLIQSINMAAPGTTCSPSINSVTTTSGTTVTASLQSFSSVSIGGTLFVTTLTTTLTGTYTGSAPSYGVSGTASATATARKALSGSPCTPDPAFGNCSVSANNVNWSGTVASADIHNLASGDTATVSGSNAVFNTVVTGTAANCGPLTALNNGRVIFTSVGLLV